MSRDLKGSELEGLGFNLDVAPPHIIVSLISETRVGSEIWRSEMTSLMKTEVKQERQGGSKS